MASYNRVILVGNLTRDPQLSYLPSNTPVVEFGIATTYKWRGQDGQDHEDTCFVDCNLFGRGAEVFNQYMNKGRPVLVEGRLKYRQWETPEGQKRNKLSVVVEKFQFLGSRGDGAPRAEGQPPAARSAGAPPARAPRPAGVPAAGQQTPPGAMEEQPAPSYEEEVPPPPTEGDVPF
jgi:single-strand DNA-binding protein